MKMRRFHVQINVNSHQKYWNPKIKKISSRGDVYYIHVHVGLVMKILTSFKDIINTRMAEDFTI